MADRLIHFMVSASGSAPDTLPECIRLLSNASAGFCRSWAAGENNDALATSQEAFRLLDHIQSELLRRRDDLMGQPAWAGSPLQLALAVHIGLLIEPTDALTESNFKSQALGAASFPSGATTSPLKLVDALNKVKHRSSMAVNFKVLPDCSHHLYILTLGGNGRSNSISSFEVQQFCRACNNAAAVI